MHELSIAESLLDAVHRVTPAGAVVRIVHVRAGPMRAIEPEALAWAWQAATADSDLASSTIELESLPWSLHCPDCQREFTSADVYAPCTCGNTLAHPVPDANEVLQITSLTVEDPSETPTLKPSTTKQ